MNELDWAVFGMICALGLGVFAIVQLCIWVNKINHVLTTYKNIEEGSHIAGGNIHALKCDTFDHLKRIKILEDRAFNTPKILVGKNK